MTHDNHIGGQEDVVGDFLLSALFHNAVIDRLTGMLPEYAVEGKIYAEAITKALRSLIAEVLDGATVEDWRYVARSLSEYVQGDVKAHAEDIRAAEELDASRVDPRSTQAPAQPSDAQNTPERFLALVRLGDDADLRVTAMICEANTFYDVWQIAADVNDMATIVDVFDVWPVSDLQVVYPLAHSRRYGLIREM